MAKFQYRGKDVEALKSLGLAEVAALLPARQRRSLRRGLTEKHKKLLQKIKKNPQKFHRTRSRDMIILPDMLGTKIGIYNGKEYVAVEIAPEMLGHRLGEFALTRKRVQHSAPGVGATKSSKFIPLK